MNMKQLLTLVAFFATIHASAQQVNPVPDYVFANRMSAGRNTVTDTAAYFSIGPRYGATRGMMPPMVVDTASFSGNKRNGLLIFSIQKNKFLYWDSVGVKWAEMAGTGGSAITGSGVAGYMPEFTTTTNLDTTLLFHSAGRFAIGGTTVSNGILSVYGGNIYTDNDLRLGSTTDWGVEAELTNFQIVQRTANRRNLTIDSAGNIALGRLTNTVGSGANLYINTNREVIIANNSTDVGDFALQVTGNGYVSGNVGIGTTSPNTKLTVGAASGTLGLPTTASFYGTNTLSSSIGTVGIFSTESAAAGVGPVLTFGGQSGNAATPYPFAFIQASKVSATAGNYAGQIDFHTVPADGGAPVRRLRISGDGEILINTTTDNGDFRLQVNGNAEIRGNIRTSAPPGGTANDWRLGTVATVSPTSPNRTIEVSIGGTIYYIAAKTTND